MPRINNLREAASWQAMKTRCLNARHIAFHLYGGRGISVCDRWMTFETFLKDMGPRPTGASLERIDSDGDYEPDNCRWANRQEQSRNRRTSPLLTINGVTKRAADWAFENDLRPGLIHERLERGFSGPALIAQPLRHGVVRRRLSECG